MIFYDALIRLAIGAITKAVSYTHLFSKTGNNNLTEAFKDNVVIDYAGLRTTDLAAPVRQSFRDLIHLYVSNMDEGHKRVKMDEVARHLDNTWLAWIGGAQPDSTFYYRVHSPVILIEFDHQRPANLSGLSLIHICRS